MTQKNPTYFMERHGAVGVEEKIGSLQSNSCWETSSVNDDSDGVDTSGVEDDNRAAISWFPIETSCDAFTSL